MLNINNNTSTNVIITYFLCVCYVGVCGEKFRRLDKRLYWHKHLNFNRLFNINIFCGFCKRDKKFYLVVLFCHAHVMFMFSETSFFALSFECLICMNFSSIHVVVGVMKLGLVQNFDVKK